MEDCSRKVITLVFFKMRARAYRLHLANIATGELALFCEACGVSITNQDFVCLLWGKAEVRVAFNDRAERYHSCNLVTEREPRQMSEGTTKKLSLFKHF